MFTTGHICAPGHRWSHRLIVVTLTTVARYSCFGRNQDVVIPGHTWSQVVTGGHNGHGMSPWSLVGRLVNVFFYQINFVRIRRRRRRVREPVAPRASVLTSRS